MDLADTSSTARHSIADTRRKAWLSLGRGFMTLLKVIDLFSGIGGFSYAAEHLVGGFETVQFVECNPWCQRALRKHWPLVPIHSDICTYEPAHKAADVICGGFPCQDISSAGKNAGIKEGTRSGLFYELMRVVRRVRPQYIVLENVSAIRTRGLDIVLSTLAEAGFDAEWACIRASDVGACHRRDRWWLVAYTNNQGLQGCRTKRQLREGGEEIETAWSSSHCLSSNWRGYISEPVLCRGDDGLSSRVDRLKALGNAVVPQVAAVPLTRVKEHNRGT